MSNSNENVDMYRKYRRKRKEAPLRTMIWTDVLLVGGSESRQLGWSSPLALGSLAPFP